MIPWVEMYNCNQYRNKADKEVRAGKAFEHCCPSQKVLRGNGAAGADEAVRLLGAMAKPRPRPKLDDAMAEHTRVTYRVAAKHIGALSGRVVRSPAAQTAGGTKVITVATAAHGHVIADSGPHFDITWESMGI